MRHTAVLLAAVLVVLTFDARAQINPSYTLPQASASNDALVPAVAPAEIPGFALADAVPSSMPAASPLSLSSATSAALSNNPSDAAQQPPSVYKVYQQYDWQIYAGYSFYRYYVTSKPNITENMNGLDLGIVFFFPKVDWFGIEGQYVGAYSSLFGERSQFDFGSGGVRFRWPLPRGLIIWIHGMGGWSRLTPQTAFGPQNAWGYEVGGGLDIGPPHKRFGYRVEADLVGTRYFGTYQDSPRIAAGVFFRY
jgi:hypothetical protein